MIVTGTLRREGNDLTINVALVDVGEEHQLWGKLYPRKLSDILDVQDEIARDVAANLRLRLTGEEDQRLTKRHTPDPEAYLLYREGIYHFGKITEQGFETAIDYCQRALKKDPKYALAHATLGRCYLALGSIYRGPKETYPEAEKHLAKALEIDNTLPEAHAAMGVNYLFHDWNWAAAERELKQGIDLESNGSSWNQSYYGFYLAAMDKLPQALTSIRRSQELDPLAAAPRNHLAECYNRMRQYDQAIAEAQEALKLDPKFVLIYGELGLAHTQQRMHEKALEVLHKGKGHPWIRGLLGYAYARAEQPAEARRVLEELKGLAKERRFGAAFGIARIHAALGEKDQAFEWLRKACDERDAHVIWLKVDPTLDNLRSDPRFTQVLKDMGLPP
jgi:tetratricopeptide (TPR) repeat protein